MKKLFIIPIVALTAFIAACSAPADAQEGFYGGTSVGYEDSTTASGFIGYDVQGAPLYYGAEVAYSFGDTDTMSISARAGTELYKDLIGYGLFGFGWQTDSTNINGLRYGLGGKYNIDENFFTGIEFIHQEYQGSSNDSTNLRVGFRF